MAAPDPDPFERTGQTLPVSSDRRVARRTLGCLFLVIILALLLWFGITHTGTGQNRNPRVGAGSGGFAVMLGFG